MIDMIIETQNLRLLISHSQILIKSRSENSDFGQWGDTNVEQGAVIYSDYITFDPIPDTSFGANIILSLANDFEIDERTARAILVPFTVTNKSELAILSVSEEYKIDLNLYKYKYKLYFEVAEENDEVFYKFTFVESDEEVTPIYLMDDNWGGEKGKELVLGYQ